MKTHMLRGFFGMLLAVPVILAIQVYGPWMEQTVFPVLKDGQATNVRRVEDGVTFLVAVRKLRDCRTVEGSLAWHAVTATDDGDFIGRLNVENEQGQVSTGRAVLGASDDVVLRGPFRASLTGANVSAHILRATLRYACHNLWQTPATFVEIHIPNGG